MTGKQKDRARSELLTRALEAFDAGGIGAVVCTLKRADDPTQAGQAFDDLSRNLYQAHKDVTSMIAVAEAGIAFCLDRARHAEGSDDPKALKAIAKTIAFNAGANCWPGWGDKGIEIAPAHIQAGLKLAEICCNLARELQLGPQQDRNGTWLVGALKLAAGEPAAALAKFQEVRSSAERSGDTVNALMAAGYCALARRADAVTAAAGARELELALAQLRGLGSKEANFFAEQLVTAELILLAK